MTSSLLTDHILRCANDPLGFEKDVQQLSTAGTGSEAVSSLLGLIEGPVLFALDVISYKGL
jgi:hypothetical protein